VSKRRPTRAASRFNFASLLVIGISVLARPHDAGLSAYGLQSSLILVTYSDFPVFMGWAFAGVSSSAQFLNAGNLPADRILIHRHVDAIDIAIA
jgi:hypothetical protein